jgi:hypothetical protein
MRRRTWLAGIGTSLASVFIHRQCEAAEKNRTYNGAQSSVSLDPLAFKAIEWLRKEQQPDGGFRQVRARVSNNAELSRVGSSALAGLALVRAGQNIADQSRGAALLSLAKFVCSRLVR